MNLHKFIFSHKSNFHYSRHFLFWLVKYALYIFGVAFSLISNHVAEWVNIMIHVLGKYFIIILCEIAYTYGIVYWILPVYQAKKVYLSFVVKLLLLTFVSYIIMGICSFWYAGILSLPIGDLLIPAWSHTGLFISAGPPVACGLFLSIKMLKNYYQKTEEKTTLLKENAFAEMQLLKAQVHPHFLFNTLNNIYSFTLNKSPRAAEMVLKLSDTVKYMVNDCSAAMVPLKNELKMLQDYMGLEDVRYGGRLDMQVEIMGEYNDKKVAPLLMIPFIENSFKHGTSKVLAHPWLKLKISVDNHYLYFDLANNQPPVVLSNHHYGIGLKNVKKRLHILYPGQHDLKIEPGIGDFTVHLKVPVEIETAQGNFLVKEDSNDQS